MFHQVYSSPDGSEIKKVSSLRDLGVTMTENAKFDKHMNNVAKKARKYAWVATTGIQD